MQSLFRRNLPTVCFLLYCLVGLGCLYWRSPDLAAAPRWSIAFGPLAWFYEIGTMEARDFLSSFVTVALIQCLFLLLVWHVSWIMPNIYAKGGFLLAFAAMWLYCGYRVYEISAL